MATAYQIVGRCDSVEFARAEHLAKILKDALALSEQEIVIEMRNPEKWSEYIHNVTKLYGFQSYFTEVEKGNEEDGCIVWNHRNKRLVGGERAFRQELEAKYNIMIDDQRALFEKIAQENTVLYRKGQAYLKAHQAEVKEHSLGVVVAGPPAGGKGTQCEKIKERFGLVHISTGDLLREAVMAQSAFGRKIKRFMEKGELVPDEIVIKMVKDRLDADDVRQRGWLLDGFPRTKEQALALEKYGVKADLFLLLNVPDIRLVDRVTGRRSDPVTGKIYHMKSNPPPTEEIAKRVVHRVDDTEAAIRTRISKYHANLNAIRDNYKDVLVEIDGDRVPDAVFADVVDVFERKLQEENPRLIRQLIEEEHGLTKRVNMIISGPPAAGKGTQCEFIKKEWGLAHISTGDLLREAVQNKTPVGAVAAGFMARGELVPDELIIDLVTQRLAQDDVKHQGWLLDGFPRTKAQADSLTSKGIRPDLFILLEVDDDELVERVVGRRSDPETGKIYHLKFNPPPPDAVHRLQHRTDDTKEAVQVRLLKYHENVAAVRGSYEDVIVSVNGGGGRKPDQVFQHIRVAVLDKLD